MAFLRMTIVLVAVAFIADSVSGKSMMRVKKDQDHDAECAMKMMSCVFPLMQFSGTSGDEIREQVLEQGLSYVCTPLSGFTDCFTNVIRECDVPLQPEQREGLDMMIKLTNFICKENLNAINSDRRCLFGDALEESTNTRCGQPDVDQLAVCQISTHIDCAADVYSDVCSNPSLAAKFRNLGRELERDAGCHRTLKVRQMINDIVARF